MTTTIISNGSKWAGEAPDSVETLLAVLAEHPLDRRFEEYGNFIFAYDAQHTRFWGNFFTLSHVFNIDTDEPEMAERLTAAIRANQQRADYLAQPNPERVRPGRIGAARRQAERARQARAVLRSAGA